MTHYAAVADDIGKEVVDKVFRTHGNHKGEIDLGHDLKIQKMHQNIRDMVGFDPAPFMNRNTQPSFMSRNIQFIRKKRRRR